MKNQYTVAIIEDNETCASSLQNSLSQYPGFTITGLAKDCHTGKKLLLEKQPDLLFLDVELPDSTGIELLQQVKDLIFWPMHVIFYTAYEKYLLAALRESAFDFLLKPYEPVEFQQIISRFLTHTSRTVHLHQIASTVSSFVPINRILLIATITGYQVFKVEQIGCFVFDKLQKQWNIISDGATRTPMKRTTRAVDILTYSSSFIQTSQQHIINIEYLYAITDKKCRMLPPFDHLTDLHISRIYMKELQNKINQL
ncbi:hypothetical protein A9168_02280 [Macellibacteroides sp. HH-ZS]|nr:hypothetical protein A9168_02280 [Macellibacteroides sp. HH-ZS]